MTRFLDTKEQQDNILSTPYLDERDFPDPDCAMLDIEDPATDDELVAITKLGWSNFRINHE